MAFDNFVSALNQASEKESLDKVKHDRLISAQDAARMRDLVKKETLTISDTKELATLCCGNENKHLNFGEYERIAFAHYEARIEDHASLVVDVLQQSEAYNKYFDEESAKEISPEKKLLITQTKNMRDIIEKTLTEEMRQAVDPFLFLTRSTLSLETKGLEYFAREGKIFNSNVPLQNVQKEML